MIAEKQTVSEVRSLGVPGKHGSADYSFFVQTRLSRSAENKIAHNAQARCSLSRFQILGGQNHDFTAKTRRPRAANVERLSEAERARAANKSAPARLSGRVVGTSKLFTLFLFILRASATSGRKL